MELETLKQRFFEIVSPSLPNEWEVEDVVLQLLELSEDNVEILFGQIAVIWPVSHSLCFAYLVDGIKFAPCIPHEHFAKWSKQVLNLYETGGLLAARKLMADPKGLFLAPMEGLSGVDFENISERMQLYLDGLSGGKIALSTSRIPKTDTRKIYVPHSLHLFSAQDENSCLYKLIISLQWAHIKSRVFQQCLALDKVDTIASHSIFARYPDTQKAKDLFSILQFIHSFWLLEEFLPGLVNRSRLLCLRLIDKIETKEGGDAYTNIVKSLLRYAVSDADDPRNNFMELDDRLLGSLERLQMEGAPNVLSDCYALLDGVEGRCDFSDFSVVLGEFDFDEAETVIERRRNDEKNAFVAMFAEALNNNQDSITDIVPEKNMEESGGANLLVLDSKLSEDKIEDKGEYLLDNPGVELSDELRAVIAEIVDDLGALPEAYVQAASGMAGKGVNNRESPESEESLPLVPYDLVPHAYDEWDYRRGGYRKRWCTLYEKKVNSVTSTFIEDTLYKYKGAMHKIRRQFEMLRNQNRFVRRRRYGDDIDFDALVDALGDCKAGLTPSDRLFVRLLRDRREISTCFLVDMSNSTEGWVSSAVKESLVLMMEAMEVVGDPYAIYGFSGMRRSKSEVFPIKEFSDSYSEAIKRRVAAIAPKEYTRMGPPIRHMTKKLLENDSRVRLLIVFSDGKPEDYDDYKGKYAIEDTRKAILEARGIGVQVFCITIDKTAHEYLGHMFGRGQFVFIDHVDALPGKLVELYRMLTQ